MQNQRNFISIDMSTKRNTKTVNIELRIKQEIKELNLLVDYKGNVFRPPYTDKAGRKWKIKPLKPFVHDTIIAIQHKNKIYNLDKLLLTAIEVDYKTRFDILEVWVPDNIKHCINRLYGTYRRSKRR